MPAGQRTDPQNKKERNKAAAEAEEPDHEKYTGTTDGTPVGKPVGSTVRCSPSQKDAPMALCACQKPPAGKAAAPGKCSAAQLQAVYRHN